MDIKKLINLIEKTGDRLVVIDRVGNPAYVIMGFSAYEKLIEGKAEISDLTEDELLEKINRDVSIWRSSQEEAKLQEFETLEQVLQKEEQEEVRDEGEKYYFEPVE